MAWIATAILAFLVGMIVRAEVVCGRKRRDFFDTITPEIDALQSSARQKYRSRFGKDPTEQFPIPNHRK